MSVYVGKSHSTFDPAFRVNLSRECENAHGLLRVLTGISYRAKNVCAVARWHSHSGVGLGQNTRGLGLHWPSMLVAETPHAGAQSNLI